MRFIDEFKRMRTRAFWERVSYWCAIKWSGKKREPIPSDDWLPILTSFAIGVILLLILLTIRRFISG